MTKELTVELREFVWDRVEDEEFTLSYELRIDAVDRVGEPLLGEHTRWWTGDPFMDFSLCPFCSLPGEQILWWAGDLFILFGLLLLFSYVFCTLDVELWWTGEACGVELRFGPLYSVILEVCVMASDWGLPIGVDLIYGSDCCLL